MELSMVERSGVTNRMAPEYRRGSRSEKTKILDRVCELTGWHRDHARTRLREASAVRVVTPRKARQPTYSARVIAGLEVCWRVAREPAGKRLAPMLVDPVPPAVDRLARDMEIASAPELFEGV